MCSAVGCNTCGKATWEGCGQHIEEALAGFAEDQKCNCESSSDLSAWLPSN